MGWFEKASRPTRSTVAFILLSLVALGPLGAQQQDWEALLAEGDRALEASDYETAKLHYQAALSRSRAFTDQDPRKVAALVHLARLYRAEGDFAEPEKLYHSALRLSRASSDKESQELARLIFEIGSYYHLRRKYEEAESYYLEAFGARVRLLGREHHEVADSINNLAILYENQARFSKAESYYDTAIKIREKTLGPDHLKTAVTRENFARLLHKMQRGVEARTLQEQAAEVRRPLIEKAAGKPVDLGEIYSAQAGLRPPEIDEQFEPEYTLEARIARHEGASVLEVEIDAEGRARNVRVVRPLGLGLDEKAIEAVRRWRFKPASLQGKRVPFRTRLEIKFQLL